MSETKTTEKRPSNLHNERCACVRCLRTRLSAMDSLLAKSEQKVAALTAQVTESQAAAKANAYDLSTARAEVEGWKQHSARLQEQVNDSANVSKQQAERIEELKAQLAEAHKDCVKQYHLVGEAEHKQSVIALIVGFVAMALGCGIGLVVGRFGR